MPQSVPRLSQGSQQPLGIQSVVSDLPLYTFTISGECSIGDVMTHFIQLGDLPGVVIVEAERVNVLSRQKFLETWLQFGHTPGFSGAAIRTMLSPASCRPVVVSSQSTILSGAKQALKRPGERQSDPLLIQKVLRPTYPENNLPASQSASQSAQLSPLSDQSLDVSYHLLDAHTLNIAHWQIRGIEIKIRHERLQMQLLQSEKMAALGRLVDGVAHEILDPVSFIWGNLRYIASYSEQQSELIAAYEQALPETTPDIDRVREDIEFDYVRSDLPAAIASARGGAHRLRQLATSLQNFCHIDDVHPRPTDINTLLDSTLRLLKSRLTTPINIERSYGKLPPVPCFSGQLSQVFMNIFINAVDSLLAQAQQEAYLQGEDYDPENALHVSTEKTPQITVTTCVFAAEDKPHPDPNEARWISIIISDNGPGLLPATKDQIIESFSTRSRSFKETGLAMSYQIITAKHGGKFWMRSLHASEELAIGKENPTTGTEFEILLPLTNSEEIK